MSARRDLGRYPRGVARAFIGETWDGTRMASIHRRPVLVRRPCMHTAAPAHSCPGMLPACHKTPLPPPRRLILASEAPLPIGTSVLVDAGTPAERFGTIHAIRRSEEGTPDARRTRPLRITLRPSVLARHAADVRCGRAARLRPWQDLV